MVTAKTSKTNIGGTGNSIFILTVMFFWGLTPSWISRGKFQSDFAKIEVVFEKLKELISGNLILMKLDPRQVETKKVYPQQLKGKDFLLSGFRSEGVGPRKFKTGGVNSPPFRTEGVNPLQFRTINYSGSLELKK